MIYKVDRFEKGIWIPKFTCDYEDPEIFSLIANVEEFKYRVTCDGKDVTKDYKRNKKTVKKEE